MIVCAYGKNYKLELDKVINLLIELENIDFKGFMDIFERLNKSDKVDENLIGYYLLKLEEGNLLRLEKNDDESGEIYISFANMTYEGHEFIRNMNNSTVKAKIFKKLKDSSGEISLDVLKNLASKFALEFFTQ
ncbi:MAG: DUF2513 domain-containing protein [Candidatus Kapaibacterium sp.]|nr:DUF2513 domain-containing protein [Ignavibacteria bacterium]